MSRANDLTHSAINYLKHKGFFVWRNNTVGVYDAQKKVYRANPYTLKGVPDVIGFRNADGLFVGVEIKIGADKLSVEQDEFLSKLQAAGGIGIAIKSIDQLVFELEKFENPDNSEKKRFLAKVFQALQNGQIDKTMPLSVLERILI